MLITKTLEFPRLRLFGFFWDSITMAIACGKLRRKKNKIAETERSSVALVSQFVVCDCALVTNHR
jgi:hypothetical protein